MKTTSEPRTFVNFKEVKAGVGILQVLDRYGLAPTLKRTADRLSGPCPLHGGTNPTQFRVSVSKNCWNCFGNCGRGGNVIDFVQAREGVTFREAALLLQEWFMPERAPGRPGHPPPLPGSPRTTPSMVSTGPQEGSAEGDRIEDENAGCNPPLDFELKSLRQDHPYASERGLTEATVKSYGIGYCSRGCLRGYVAIPIRNRDGRLVAYMGRWPGTPPCDSPKYKLPKGFRKALELFNLDRALQSDAAHPLLVVEGVFDCLRLVQLGYPRTVALLGSALSLRQEELLREAAGPGGRVFLLLDADAAGRQGASEAAARLCRHCTVRIVDIGTRCSQPDQLTGSDMEALLAA